MGCNWRIRRNMENRRMEERVECVCPMCGVTHVKRLYWTGRGKPRKFCKSCHYTAHIEHHHPEELRAVTSGSGVWRGVD